MSLQYIFIIQILRYLYTFSLTHEYVLELNGFVCLYLCGFVAGRPYLSLYYNRYAMRRDPISTGKKEEFYI